MEGLFLLLGIIVGILLTVISALVFAGIGKFTLRPVPADDSGSFYSFGLKLPQDKYVHRKRILILLRVDDSRK